MDSRLINIVRFFSLSAIGFALILSCTGSSNNSDSRTSHDFFQLDFTISGMNGGYVFLTGMYGGQFYTIDSFMVDSKGFSSIQHASLLPQGMYYVVLPDRYTSIQFIVTDEQNFSMSSDVSDFIGHMQIKGNEETSLLYENLKFEQQYREEYEALRERVNRAPEGTPQAVALEAERQAKIDERVSYIQAAAKKHPDAFFTKFKLAGQNPRLTAPKLPNGEIDNELLVTRYRQHYWDGMDFSDERLLRTPVYSNKLRSFFEKVVPQQIDSLTKYAGIITRASMQSDSLFKFTANYVGMKYQEPTFMGSDAVYVYMVENFFTHELAYWAQPHEINRLQQDAAIRHSSMLGEKAKDIQVIAPDGNMISLLDSDAKLLVLYIYTPNCENCQKETPLVKQAYDRWKNKGVEVFALCTDPDEDLWKNYIAQNDLDWINAFDPMIESEYTFKYHIDITPEIYVLDQDRIIVARDLHAFQLDEIFGRHLE